MQSVESFDGISKKVFEFRMASFALTKTGVSFIIII